MFKEFFDLFDTMKKNIEISKRTSEEWFALYFRRTLLITLNTLCLLIVIAGAILL